jgi:hypothetical protein
MRFRLLHNALDDMVKLMKKEVLKILLVEIGLLKWCPSAKIITAPYDIYLYNLYTRYFIWRDDDITDFPFAQKTKKTETI